jgi:hypothetical protein
MYLGDPSNAAAWTAAGYSAASLTSAWGQTIDAFKAAFPAQHLTLAISDPVTFEDPTPVVQAVIAHARQAGAGIQGNWLSAKTPTDDALYQDVAAFAGSGVVGFQMLAPSSTERFGGALATALQLAVAAHASFLEIYKPDIAGNADLLNLTRQQLLAQAASY